MLRLRILTAIHLSLACIAWLGQASLSVAAAGDSCPPRHTFSGEGGPDLFGWAIEIAEDINNDGFDDILIGAPTSDSGGASAGRVYVFSGSNGDTLFVLDGVNAGDRFGLSVCGTGDVNGDGHGDFAVAAPLSGIAGTVTIFSGVDASILHSFSGSILGESFGRSIAAAGDVNNDGVGDIVIGAHLSDEAGTNAGKAYVFSGADFEDTLLVALGEFQNGWLGEDVSGAGDVNGDGFDDVILAANGIVDSTNPGHVYVYSGQTAALLYRFTGEAPLDRFGITVDGAGDVNNDGYNDVVVGASRQSAGGMWAGRAYVFFGDSGSTFQDILAADADVTLTGRNAFDRFGVGVTGIQDLNGDGHDEIAVGAQWSLDSDSTGEVLIFSGQDTTLLYSITGEAHGDQFGHDVSVGNDINGDGYMDLIVNAVNAQRVYVHVMADADLDGVLVDCDNCPAAANQLQEDADLDGFGDSCDNCIVVANSDQLITITMTGDVNESGTLTSADIIYLVNFVFKSQVPPLPCEASGDVNCSGTVTSADIIYMVNHVFKSQAPPCDVCGASGLGWTCP